MARKKNILVIDDEEATRQLFELALADSGYFVTIVDTGVKGIQVASKKRFHLVFVDLKMPDMDGAVVLEKLCRVPVRAPICIVTAYHNDGLGKLETVRKKGLPFQLLRKPIGSIEIRTLVHSVLEKSMELN